MVRGDDERTPSATRAARYVADEAGHRVAALLDIKTYERLLDALEGLESVRAYNAAKASGASLDPVMGDVDR